MTFIEFMTFSAFAWVSSFTPGPNVAVATATGVNFGLRAAVPQVIGTTLGFVLMTWLIAIGGSQIFTSFPIMILILKILGNSYLLYLSYRLCCASSLAEQKTIRPFSWPQAAMFQIINPKAWMTMIAVATTYVIGHADFFTRMWAISLGLALPCALSLTTWAWAGQKLRNWLLVGSRLRKFNFSLGITLALTAVLMLLT